MGDLSKLMDEGKAIQNRLHPHINSQVFCKSDVCRKMQGGTRYSLKATESNSILDLENPNDPNSQPVKDILISKHPKGIQGIYTS